jgi:hypothetical protein
MFDSSVVNILGSNLGQVMADPINNLRIFVFFNWY